MVSTFIARGAEGYDGFMGRWSRRLAPLFLDFAGSAPDERVLEVGCGTGSLTFVLAARGVAAIEAIDYEKDFVAALRERNRDPRITARQGDACALAFPDGAFDRALAMLVLHFVSDAQLAAREMRRVVRQGGVVAAAVWDQYGGMPWLRMFWDTISAIEPAAIERRAQSYFRPTSLPGELRSVFEHAGFEKIEETMLTIRMDFQNFDDYWHPMLLGQGTLSTFMESLPKETSQRVERGVRDAYLCNRPDGPRSFASVAWAVKGVVPRL